MSTGQWVVVVAVVVVVALILGGFITIGR